MRVLYNRYSQRVASGKDPGGLDAFVNEFGAQCNDHITVFYDMGSDIGEVFEALNECGMEFKVDFTTLDAVDSEMLCSFMPKKRGKTVPGGHSGELAQRAVRERQRVGHVQWVRMALWLGALRPICGLTQS